VADAAGDSTPYEAGFRLIKLILTYWGSIDGRLSLRGIDIETMPVDRALNVVYAFLIEDMDNEAQAKFDSAIFRIDPIEPPRRRKQLASPSKPNIPSKDGAPSWWIQDPVERARQTQAEIRKLQG
jgi:hypothetical protein